MSDPPTEARVVGVIGDHHHDGISATKDPLVYLPLAGDPLRRRFLVVRGDGAPTAFVAPLRRAMLDVDPDLPVDFRPMSAVVQENAYQWTVGSAVLAVFGLVAMLLAALGIYGVVAYAVSQRHRGLSARAKGCIRAPRDGGAGRVSAERRLLFVSTMDISGVDKSHERRSACHARGTTIRFH